jgi:hypothetical protein
LEQAPGEGHKLDESHQIDLDDPVEALKSAQAHHHVETNKSGKATTQSEVARPGGAHKAGGTHQPVAEVNRPNEVHQTGLLNRPDNAKQQFEEELHSAIPNFLNEIRRSETTTSRDVDVHQNIWSNKQKQILREQQQIFDIHGREVVVPVVFPIHHDLLKKYYTTGQSAQNNNEMKPKESRKSQISHQRFLCLEKDLKAVKDKTTINYQKYLREFDEKYHQTRAK